MATSQAIIVDYQAGNVESVQRACHAVGIDALISADPNLIRKAERLIFPGVGTAESAVNTLHETGIWEALLTSRMPADRCSAFALVPRFYWSIQRREIKPV